MDTAFAKRLVFVNAAVPLALLAWDTYKQQLGVNGVNYALHTTGLVALVLLLSSLAITPARKLTGWNALIAVRRTLGLYAFFYLCVHFTIFFVFDRAASVGSTVHEILTRRYLQIGTAALLLFVPLAVTSTDAMVRRLGTRWKKLHRVTYVATALGALHYYMLVKADVRQPLAFAGVLALLLLARPAITYFDERKKERSRTSIAPRLAATPARERRFWSGDLRVVRIFDETHDVRTFRLAPLDGTRLPFTHQPGQYLNIALTIGGARVNRSYTIASSPTQAAYCEVTVKRKEAGLSSPYFHDVLREGASVKISAPAGRFVFTGQGEDGVVLVAGGVGITPLMAMIRYLTDHSWPGAIYLVFSVRAPRDVIFADELAHLQRRFPNLHVVLTLTGKGADEWNGHRGRLTEEMLRNAVPDIARLSVYLCGPDAMMEGTRGILLRIGVPQARLFTEEFTSSTTAVVRTQDAIARAEDNEGPAVLDAPPMIEGSGAMVNFRRSKKMADLPPDRTILEAAEDAGLDLPFECRSGICGQCKTKLLGGQVTMDVEDALSADDKANGLILACQARSRGDVAIDA